MGELPDDNAAEARRWLGQAAEDLVAAHRIAEDPELVPRLACFLAHLAAEKALKAVLIDSAVPFRKIHDTCPSSASCCRPTGRWASIPMPSPT